MRTIGFALDGEAAKRNLSRMSLTIHRTTGDAAADRRYAWGAAAAAAGDHTAAADLFAQALELAPSFAPAAFARGQSLEAMGDAGGAGAAFAAALVLDPGDGQGAALHLARLGQGQVPALAPPAYVRGLFDAYAPQFDAHLVRGLGYDAPRALANLIRTVTAARFGAVLDLGCGTGLAGEVFRAQCDDLAGVDLSPGMVEVAKAKNIYDRLAVQDLAAFLQAEAPGNASLILAADVFVYIGDLAAVFDLSARALAPGGLMAFTVQQGDAGFSLGADFRYAHSLAYIGQLAATAGLALLKSPAISTRMDRGVPVPGLGIVLAKPA